MLKLITEFSPLVAFFVGYKMDGIIAATCYMLVVTGICMAISYFAERKINTANLISTLLLLVSASLTIFSGNSIFIKMKPTVLYLIFALTFFVTNFKWQPATKMILGKAINLEEQKWKILNIRFMLFFITMATANELIWRNFSEAFWVNFKVFGALPITILFLLTQTPFILRHKI